MLPHFNIRNHLLEVLREFNDITTLVRVVICVLPNKNGMRKYATISKMW